MFVNVFMIIVLLAHQLNIFITISAMINVLEDHLDLMDYVLNVIFLVELVLEKMIIVV
jgi:hypothetical protein